MLLGALDTVQWNAGEHIKFIAQGVAHLRRPKDVGNGNGNARERLRLHKVKKAKFSRTCYLALGPELIQVYRQSACR